MVSKNTKALMELRIARLQCAPRSTPTAKCRGGFDHCSEFSQPKKCYDDYLSGKTLKGARTYEHGR